MGGSALLELFASAVASTSGTWATPPSEPIPNSDFPEERSAKCFVLFIAGDDAAIASRQHGHGSASPFGNHPIHGCHLKASVAAAIRRSRRHHSDARLLCVRVVRGTVVLLCGKIYAEFQAENYYSAKNRATFWRQHSGQAGQRSLHHFPIEIDVDPRVDTRVQIAQDLKI